MTNSCELKAIIDASGLKFGYIAEQLGLSRNGLYKKVNNEIEFKPSEIDKLCDILHITSLKERQHIFFYKKS